MQVRVGFRKSRRRVTSYTCIKCEKKDDNVKYEYVELPPYHVYRDSTSGELEPASGARASIPEQEYWPEGTANRVRAARAPEPRGESSGSPSYGQKPGSRRKKYKSSAAASSEVTVESTDPDPDPDSPESLVDSSKDTQDFSSDYVVYQSEPEEEETGFELDKKLGRPHPFIDPKVKKPIENPRTSEELWWNWRKPEKEQWSRWQRRRPDVETVSVYEMVMEKDFNHNYYIYYCLTTLCRFVVMHVHICEK